jgi:hypothetical protein
MGAGWGRQLAPRSPTPIAGHQRRATRAERETRLSLGAATVFGGWGANMAGRNGERQDVASGEVG